MPAGILAVVVLFGFTLLVGLSAVTGPDVPPWQDILLDEDETDIVESKLSLAIPDGQPAMPGTCHSLSSCHPLRTLVQDAPRPPVQLLTSAPASPRAPPAV